MTPDVDRIVFTVDGEPVVYRPVDGGDRGYVGIVLEVPPGAKTKERVAYDAQGERVPLPE